MRASARCLLMVFLAAVPVFASGPHGIYVAFPVNTGPDYTAEYNYLITGPGAPYITGAACYPDWASLEPANGTYNWSFIDGAHGCLTEWAGADKHVGLILGTSSYGSSNQGTPAWYTTPAKIVSVSQSAASHIISLTVSAATPLNFFVGRVAGQQIQLNGTRTGLDGVWTILSNSDSTHLTALGVSSNDGKIATAGSAGNPMIIDSSDACGGGASGQYLPVFWSPNFVNAWEGFLTAATARYNGNPYVDFYQPGFGRGFENYAASNAGGVSCNAVLTPLGYSTTAFVSYLASMSTFISHAAAGKAVVFSLNYLDYPACSNRNSASCDNADVLATAAGAALAGLGLGSQGLSASDLTTSLTGSPCDNNSCAAFAGHPSAAVREWQSASLSDPTGGNSTGNLASLLPFAVDQGATVLEPYTNDALCAFDPSWAGSSTNSYAACNRAGYAAAFMSAAEALDRIEPAP
jgi:hypothetical protein